MKLKIIRDERHIKIFECLKEKDIIQYHEFFSMFEKKERELLSKYKNSAVIFKYEMFDAWDKHLLTIDIHNNGTVKIELIDRSLHYQMKEYEIMNLSEMISTKSSVFLNDSFYIEDINIYDGYRYKILLDFLGN